MKASDFHFLGDRDYLQGATLFDHIIANYVADKYNPKGIDFSIKKLTDKVCLVISTKEKKGNLIPEKIVGEYKDNLNHFFIYETENKVTERIPYNEIEIIRNCIIDKDKIVMSENILNYSFMKKAIAAYKFLLTSLYGKTYDKYLFARIQLQFIPEGKFWIKHSRIISNQFFQGAIKENDKEIGNIFFGVKKI